MKLLPRAIVLTLLACATTALAYSPPHRPTPSVRIPPVLPLLTRPDATQSIPEPGDPIWRKTQGMSLLVVRSGRPSFDDALEEGLKTSWKSGPWRWLSDSEITANRPDSAVLLLRTLPWYNIYPATPISAPTCPCSDLRKGDFCISPDSASLVRLELIPPQGHARMLYQEATELRTQPQLDGMAVDIAKDFQDILAMGWSDSVPDPDRLSKTDDWQNLVLSRTRVGICPACTIFVAREYGIRATPAQLAEATGHPARIISGDTLDQLLGNRTSGLYLEGSSRSKSWEILRVRTLSDGKLLASSEWNRLIFLDRHQPDSEIALARGSFDNLGHRLAGDELRIAWDATTEFAYAAGTLNFLAIGGAEVIRGLFATSGAGIALAPSLYGRTSYPELEVGARWFPRMGIEPRVFGSRVFLDLSLLQPLGSATQSGKWGPTLLVGALTLRSIFWEIGAGFAEPIVHGVQGSTPLFVRFGVNIEGRLWKKKDISVLVPRDPTPNPSIPSETGPRTRR